MSEILYLVADLRRVGPTNQTFNIITNANNNLNKIKVLALFEEPEESLKEKFLQAGIKCDCLNLRRNSIFSGILKLKKYLKHNHFDLIHSYGVKPDVLVFFVAKLIHIKYLFTLRCVPFEDYPYRMNRIVGILTALLHTFALKYSKNVVACSNSVKNVMQTKYGVKNIITIQNGVNTSQFYSKDKNTCRQQLNIPQDAKVIISTGLFIPRKHNDQIIKAFLSSKLDNSLLLMLGDGPLFFALKEKYCDNRNIVFVGSVPNIIDYLSAADIFVSASDSEGLPNAVIEAIACNLPVILSDIPQHKEILEELPNCGEVFPLHNVLMLTKIMQNFSNRKTLNLTIASDFLSSPFTMKEMGNKYKAYYNKIGL